MNPKTLKETLQHSFCNDLCKIPEETCSGEADCQAIKQFKTSLRELIEGEIEEIKSKVINSEIKSTSNASLQGKLDILSEVKRALNEVLK